MKFNIRKAFLDTFIEYWILKEDFKNSEKIRLAKP